MKYAFRIWIVVSMLCSAIVPGVIYSYRTYHPKKTEAFLKTAVLELATVGYWKTRFDEGGDKYKSCVGMDRMLYGCFAIESEKIEEFKSHGFVGTMGLLGAGLHLIYTAPETEVPPEGSFAKYPTERFDQAENWISYIREKHGLGEKIPNVFALAWDAAKMAVNGDKLSNPTPNFSWQPTRLPSSVTQ